MTNSFAAAVSRRELHRMSAGNPGSELRAWPASLGSGCPRPSGSYCGLWHQGACGPRTTARPGTRATTSTSVTLCDFDDGTRSVPDTERKRTCASPCGPSAGGRSLQCRTKAHTSACTQRAMSGHRGQLARAYICGAEARACARQSWRLTHPNPKRAEPGRGAVAARADEPGTCMHTNGHSVVWRGARGRVRRSPRDTESTANKRSGGGGEARRQSKPPIEEGRQVRKSGVRRL